MSPKSKLIAIVAGVGPGTGASVARKFSQTYSVVLLARTPESFSSLAEEINKAGGKAIGIATDVSSSSSLSSAAAAIKKEFGDDVAAAAAIFNASGAFMRKPFLEIPVETFEKSLGVSGMGGVLFSQTFLPLLLKGVERGSEHPPSLIFTGATASVKSNAQMASFSTGKWALRALSQSLAREFGPQGVHVAHAIIDGVIDIPRTKEWLKDMPKEAKLSADAIANDYWWLHTQPKTNFTWEIDLRPAVEKCSRWSSKPTSKSPGDDVKTPEEPKHVAVPSFGFTMPTFTKKPSPAARSQVVSSVSSEAKSVETKKPAVKIDENPNQDLIKVETGKPQSKVAAAIQATRDQMAKIMGQRRQDRPSTANATIGRGPSASYPGYIRRDR
ncbi:hypothetical protein J4E90_006291 [Alternaria incomplexa]|uniref:uncharacterized protein n=1 Tax=Alternaria incomplexa TaxID=1187928 RepID=UPI0022210E27|nr:uncharacterized protein J4E90_006291 [Alternaria incomplexa]KAI4912883.1 hypothetical protein J4E90_006291 [Alternaria incomplexa]